MDNPESLWEPPPVPPESAAFTLAVARDLCGREAEGRAVPAVASAVLLALADQIDRLSSWLARRPEAKPADRVALARLFAQFEGTYDRAVGPARAEPADGLGAILDEFRRAETVHAEGPHLPY